MTETAKLEALKPCPFCGGKAMSGTTLDNAGYAMCVSNTCWGMAGYLPTEAEAVTAWNTRALSSRPAVKGLEWHGPDVNGEYHAKSVLGVYSIDADLWLSMVGGHFPTIEAAKAAAHSNFDQRIRSALEQSA